MDVGMAFGHTQRSLCRLAHSPATARTQK